jgi:hypothetical protein
MTKKRLADLPSEELREVSLNALFGVLCPVWMKQYNHGHKRRLLEIIGMCLMHRVPPPEDAREEFLRVCQSMPDSWDDVFGPPVPKGKSAKAARRRAANRPQVIKVVGRLRKQGTKFPAVFDEAAESPELREFKLSGSTVREMYYSVFGKEMRKKLPAVLAARSLEDLLAIHVILEAAELTVEFQKRGLDFKKEIFGDQVTGNT